MTCVMPVGPIFPAKKKSGPPQVFRTFHTFGTVFRANGVVALVCDAPFWPVMPPVCVENRVSTMQNISPGPQFPEVSWQLSQGHPGFPCKTNPRPLTLLHICKKKDPSTVFSEFVVICPAQCSEFVICPEQVPQKCSERSEREHCSGQAMAVQ